MKSGVLFLHLTNGLDSIDKTQLQPNFETHLASHAMASRILNRSHKSLIARQIALSSAPRQRFVLSLGSLRFGACAPTKPIIGGSLQFSRGVKTIDFAGHKETVYGMRISMGICFSS